MKTYIAILVVALSVTAASAQTPPRPHAQPPVAPPQQEAPAEVKALSNRLLQEISNSLRQEARAIAAEEELARLKASKDNKPEEMKK